MELKKGRPRKQLLSIPGHDLTVGYTIRLTPELRKQIEDAARSTDMELSDYIRRILADQSLLDLWAART
jgi:hypothetical protein